MLACFREVLGVCDISNSHLVWQFYVAYYYATTCPFTRVSYSTGTGVVMFSCYGNSIYWRHLDQQLFCLSCWAVLMPLCISSVMVSKTKLSYMCGTTTAEVNLSSQLFLELLPLFTGISNLLSFPYSLKVSRKYKHIKIIVILGA